MVRSINLRDVKSKTDHSMPKSFKLRNTINKKKTTIPKSNILNAVKSPWAKASTPEPCKPIKREKSSKILLSEWMKSRGIVSKKNSKNNCQDSEEMVNSCIQFIGKEIKSSRESLQMLEEISTIMPEARKYPSFWMSKAKITEMQDGNLTNIFKEAVSSIDNNLINCDDKENHTPTKKSNNKTYYLSNLTPQFKKLKTSNEEIVSVLTPVRRSMRFQCQHKVKRLSLDISSSIGKPNEEEKEEIDIITETLLKPHRMIVDDLTRIINPEKVMFKSNEAIID